MCAAIIGLKENQLNDLRLSITRQFIINVMIVVSISFEALLF